MDRPDLGFLLTYPIVYVIGDEYEVFVCTKEPGLFAIKVNGINYYEENSGVLASNKNCAKIRIPQKELDANPTYKIIYLKNIVRQGYFSKLEEGKSIEFTFKPLIKKDHYNFYHFGDIHKRYSEWIKTASFFGDEIDFFISNGDMVEVDGAPNIFDGIFFLAELSKGKYPVIFARGNHDTRGTIPEYLSEFYPNRQGTFFYTFKLGEIKGIVLDCGEDKLDTDDEYGGNTCDGERFNINDFYGYRRRETEFLKSLKGKYDFAICHICFNITTFDKNPLFNIENEEYAKWSKELKRLGIKFLISAHRHEVFLGDKHAKIATVDNPYPVFVATEVKPENVCGAAVQYTKRGVNISITDMNNKIKSTQFFKF